MVSANGLRIYCELRGRGDPLVLLHGFNVSGAVWEPAVPGLRDTYRLIVPDLRGHGRSDNPSGEFSHRLVAHDLFALLDRLRVGEFRAVGTSSGGMALLHAALLQPGRLKAMALIGATYYYPPSARAVMRQRTPDTLTPDLLARLREHHRLGDDQIRALHDRFHGFRDDYEDMDLTREKLRGIDVPTLVVHGDRDAYFPLDVAIDLYRAIPGARLWVIPNGRHIPIFDRPEEFVRVALAFFGGAWTGPA